MNDLIAAARAKRLAIPADPEFSPEVYENPLAAEVADALAAALSRIEALEAERDSRQRVAIRTMERLEAAEALLREAQDIIHRLNATFVPSQDGACGEAAGMCRRIDTFLNGGDKQ